MKCENDLKINQFAYVLSGGAALSLWIRYLFTLEDKTGIRMTMREEISTDLYKIATTVVDWDIEVSEYEVHIDSNCTIDGQQDQLLESFKKVNITYEKRESESIYYYPEKIYLRRLVAQMLPSDCQITPDSGCGYIDTMVKPPYYYEHIRTHDSATYGFKKRLITLKRTSFRDISA
jgi:hypothetical protein